MTLKRLARRGTLGLLARSRTTPCVFADFYEATCEAIFSYFLREARNKQVALDLTAETFATAFEKRCDFRGDDDRQAAKWLWGIARHILSRYRRTKEVELAALRRVRWERQTVQDDEMHEYEDAVVAVEINGHLGSALAALPDEQRRVVQLRYGEDTRNYQDIADELGVSNDVARTRTSRALRALRNSRHLNEIKLLRRT